MATLYAIVVYLLLYLTFFTTTAAAAATKKPRRLVTRLLHRESLLYNPNDTVATRAERLLNSSIARFIYLSEKSFGTHSDNNVQPSLFRGPEYALFYVNFSIGQPPVPQLAVMDTGSPLIWVNCNPTCRDCGPVFDPFKSSTFAKTPCNRTFCDSCGRTNECIYQIAYEKSTDSGGIIATEQFSFETSDEGKIMINNIVFGCGLINGDFVDNSTGVFGLGISESENFSIVKLLGSKFSYCVGNIIDHEYKFNRLVLGGAVIEGYSTPLEVFNEFYYLTLEGISIGEKRLEIDSNIFQRTSINNGVIIDSGSTHTYLPPTAYEVVRREIQHLCKGLLTHVPNQLVPDGHLCYFGEVSRDLQGFPVMTFHFAEGADLVLDAYSMFLQVGAQLFCLTLLPSDIDNDRAIGRSLIGMIAQQNYNVAYDLGTNRLYFQRIDCELLDD